MKSVIAAAILLAACGAAMEDPNVQFKAGEIYQITNRSGCLARVVLYDARGDFILQQFEDLKPGAVQKYVIPHTGQRLAAFAVDAMGRSCSVAEEQKIQMTKVEPTP